MEPTRRRGFRLRRRLLGGLAAAALLAAPGLSARAAEQEALSQWRVQAAYLLKFAEFVTWPPDSFGDPSAPLRVGVLGNDAMVAELRVLAPRARVGARPVQVRALGPGDPVEDLHVLFVGTEDEGGNAPWPASVAGRPVLTVTDDARLHAQGSMVNFVVDDRRVRFDVSLPAVDDGGLQVSALMLTAARRVARGDY